MQFCFQEGMHTRISPTYNTNSMSTYAITSSSLYALSGKARSCTPSKQSNTIAQFCLSSVIAPFTHVYRNMITVRISRGDHLTKWSNLAILNCNYLGVWCTAISCICLQSVVLCFVMRLHMLPSSLWAAMAESKAIPFQPFCRFLWLCNLGSLVLQHTLSKESKSTCNWNYKNKL
jgi:hypothetical protein